MPEHLTERIVEYIAQRKNAKQEVLDKEKSKAFAALETTASELDEETANALSEKQAKIDHDFTTVNWLSTAAKKANQIRMATHAIKFTHSAAKGSNVLAQDLGQDARYLDTFAIDSPAIDAVGNAAALDVAALLQLTDDHGKSLLSYLSDEDTRPLAPLASNRDQLACWVEGLSLALQDTSPSSHTLSKQVYFPVDSDYHLLAPLYSSALSQAIYESIQFSRYSQAMKAVRDAQKANQYSEHPLIAYPNIAMTVAGGSKPQNISKLNSGRGGVCYLLDARPPTWRNQMRQPIDKAVFFDQFHVHQGTDGLIQKVVDVMSRSIEQSSHVRFRRYISQLVDQIGEQIVNNVSVWQDQPAGWSDRYTDLPIYACQWIDPNNPRWQHENLDWKRPLAEEFGRWLKDKINFKASDTFALGSDEAKRWQKRFHQLLIEVNA